MLQAAQKDTPGPEETEDVPEQDTQNENVNQAETAETPNEEESNS